MDLTTVNPVTRPVAILHPKTGESIGLTINLHPPSHPDVKAVQRKWINQRLQRGKGKPPTAEQIEAKALEQIIAAIESWEWGNDSDGQPCNVEGDQPALTPESARKVLKLGGGFIKDQLDEELGATEDFFET